MADLLLGVGGVQGAASMLSDEDARGLARFIPLRRTSPRCVCGLVEWRARRGSRRIHVRFM